MKSLAFALFALSLFPNGRVAAASIADDDVSGLLQQATAAFRMGDLPKALKLATRAIQVDPKAGQGWLVRAQIYEAKGEYAKAVSDYSTVIAREPENAAVWQRRGEANFRGGKIADSISDFDRYLTLAPDQKPYHWQRGISLYYAGRFADGKKQFELHQTVNRQDVENAVWHFLCTARAEGIDAARRQLIPIDDDGRVPMSQVHKLFAGKAIVEDVIAAAMKATNTSQSVSAEFYANLYVGLYYEAVGESAKAKDHILKAAERSKENGYMGDVARVHALLLLKKKPSTIAKPS